MKTIVYEWEAEVLSVVEVKEKVNHRKEGEEYKFDEVSIGWSIRISDSSAVGMFKNKPALNVGDTVTMTLTKKVV